MKSKILPVLLVFFMIASVQTFAQRDPIAAVTPQMGQVDFFEGTWDELLSHAKQANKPFFVDIFTEWCGPCKLMSKFTFTDGQVADYANANFIAYQIDAEKGKGIEVADDYKVRAFPTVLFFDAQGKMVGKVVGYYDAERFLGAMDKYLKKLAK